jgi:hypothetical protein
MFLKGSMSSIADCGLWIADLKNELSPFQSTIHNPKSEIRNKKKSRAKQRGTSQELEVCGVALLGWPSCLAGYFTWPQVALTHHVFLKSVIRRATKAVKLEDCLQDCPKSKAGFRVSSFGFRVSV